MIFYSIKNDTASTITSVLNVGVDVLNWIKKTFGNSDEIPYAYPAHKYRLVKNMLEEEGYEITTVRGKLNDEDLLLVHSEVLVDSTNVPIAYPSGLKGSVLEELGFPVYTSAVKGHFTGNALATHMAALEAMDSGYAVNIGGGYHHATSNEAMGFCLINDIAISIEKLREELQMVDEKGNPIDYELQVLIIDLDCHRGNGNAEIFYDDDNTFVFSIHKKDEYGDDDDFPSDRDIALKLNSSTPKRYLEALKSFLDDFDCFVPDVIYYIAGADPYKEDEWSDGGLGLTKMDLIKRDKMVYQYAKKNNIPIVTTLGGGYADVEDVAEIHFNTVETMVKIMTK
jgi:acetoin utilization deacetylase AcuC-like enzyme